MIGTFLKHADAGDRGRLEVPTRLILRRSRKTMARGLRGKLTRIKEERGTLLSFLTTSVHSDHCGYRSAKDRLRTARLDLRQAELDGRGQRCQVYVTSQGRRTSMRSPTIAAGLLFAILSYPAFAQSPADHEAHHPGQDQVQAPAQTTSPSASSGDRQGMMRGGGMMGMMGQGMMGQGMKERGIMGAGAMGTPVMFRIIFALMDADGDGTISLPEFQAAHERLFKAI
jgi:hypothetical protein